MKNNTTFDFNEFRNEIILINLEMKYRLTIENLKTQFHSPAFFNVIKSVFNEVYKKPK